MAKAKIDLTNYRPTFGDKVDAGRYLARVTAADMQKAKSTNNDMIVVWLEIAAGPFEGKALRTNLTLTDKAMFKVVEFLSALGYKTPKKVLNIDTDQWLGKTVVIDVEERENEYQGNVTVRTEISAVFRATPDLVSTMRASGNLSNASEPAAQDIGDEDEGEDAAVEEAPASKPAKKSKPSEPETVEESTVDDDLDDVDVDSLTDDL